MPDDLRPAEPAELLEKLRYALRFDNRGKAYGKSYLAQPELLAEGVIRQLEMSGYRVFKQVRQPQPSGPYHKLTPGQTGRE